MFGDRGYPVLAAHGDYDGDVDQGDLTTWSNHYGDTAEPWGHASGQPRSVSSIAGDYDSDDDLLFGGDDDDELHGGFGDDIFNGNKGADKLWGDAGEDTLQLDNDLGSSLTLSDATSPLDGRIGTVIIHSGVLSEAARQRLEAYISAV